jgi:F-type H+-transporting ATPase subunit c
VQRLLASGLQLRPLVAVLPRVTMIIGLALIESLCIYALVVALILIFAHPQAGAIAALFAH